MAKSLLEALVHKSGVLTHVLSSFGVFLEPLCKEMFTCKKHQAGKSNPRVGMAAARAGFAFHLNPGISGKGNWKNPLKYCW